MLARLPLAGKIDLATLMTDHTERLLNLPGQLPFFATRPTPPAEIRDLLRELHPVAGRRPLIRLGCSGDGGYLVPDDLEGIGACFSPGVSTVSKFERDCAERGMKVFMADASVDGPAETHPAFRFIKKFIGASTRGQYVALDDWIAENAAALDGDFLLQMDIEGAEYEAILSLPTLTQRRFRIIVVEFHYLDYLFSEPLFRLLSAVFYKLRTTHQCVHIHPNNFAKMIRVGDLEIPQMAEFTFLRNDRIDFMEHATRFPHPLDQDNCSQPTLTLPSSCFRVGAPA